MGMRIWRKKFRKLTCICIAALLIVQSGVYLNTDAVYAEADQDAYIVITKDDEKAEKLKEDHTVLAENGDALTVELTDSQAAQMETDKDIVCVEKDFTIEAEAEAGEDMVKPLDENWNLDVLNAETASSAGRVKVAVIDSGIDVTDNIVVQERKNFIKDMPVTTPLYEDLTGHGTSVASLIVGTGTGSEVLGTGSNIELYSARVLDEKKQAPISSVVEAIYWAIEKDVNIINISFGTQTYSEALKTAIDAAADKGILVVAAVGNRGSIGVDYPAAFENVLSVGSVNAAGEVSDFSAKGEGVDVVAPGEAVLAQANFGEDLILSGTSLSAPQVSGIAARLWSRDLTKPATFIRTLIKMSANEIGTSGSGYGLVDYAYALQIYDEVAAQFESIANGSTEDESDAQPPQENEPTLPETPDEEVTEPPAAEDETPKEAQVPDSAVADENEEAAPAATEDNSIEEETQQSESPAVEEDSVTVEAEKQEGTDNLPVEEEAAVTTDQEAKEEPADMSADAKTEAIAVPDLNSVAFENMALEKIDVSANSAQITDLSDPVVDGSWGANVHKAFTGNAAFKQGAVYADDKELHPFVQGITGHPEFHGYAWHNDSGGALGSGDCNYMANYKFLVKIAAAYGRGDGYTAVSQSDVPGLSTACYKAIRAGIQGILNRDEKLPKWDDDIAIWGKSNANQKAFVMGLAMHTATDTFAHSAFKQSLVGSFSWARIEHPEADNTAVCEGRYNIAKEVIKKVVDRQNGNRSGYDTCNDFHSEISSHYTNLDFRITKMKTFAEVAGYTNSSVLSDFGKLQTK